MLTRHVVDICKSIEELTDTIRILNCTMQQTTLVPQAYWPLGAQLLDEVDKLRQELSSAIH